MELINKRKLQKDLAAYWGIPYDWDGEMDQLCEDALAAIDNADVIDAVEVVRCKDCKFLTTELTTFGTYVYCGHDEGLRNIFNQDACWCCYGECKYE